MQTASSRALSAGRAVAPGQPLACRGPSARLSHRVWPRTRSHQDRDHASPQWGDPHKQPPPHPPGGGAGDPPPAGGASFLSHAPPEVRRAHWQSVGFDESGSLSSLATSDLEFGSDALTGSTLETPQQEAHARERQHERAERLHQADLAREAAEAREAAQGIAALALAELQQRSQADAVEDALFMSEEEAREARAAAHAQLAADESTAGEREERYAGLLAAMDDIAAAGRSDQVSEELCPDAARLASTTSSQEEEEAAFNAIRHTVDELGEGEEAAELIARSYRGRNLEQEALQTMDPADPYPHPGDRYLRPPQALRARARPPPAAASRLGSSPSSSHFERHHAPTSTLPRGRGASTVSGKGQQERACGAAAGAGWLPPGQTAGGGGPLPRARATHEPVGEQEGEQEGRQGPADTGADDQIELGWGGGGQAQQAGWGGGSAEGEAADDQIGLQEQEALRGADALYYAEEHAAAAEPLPVNEGQPGGEAAGAGGVGEPGAEAFDAERDALQGGDAAFYFKSGRDGGGGGGGGEPERGLAWAALNGAAEDGSSAGAGGVLASADEPHSGFRRAMEEAAAAAAYRARSTAAAAARRYAAESSSKRHAPGATQGSGGGGGGTTGAQGAGPGGVAAERGRRGRGILASLDRRRASKAAAEEQMETLKTRLKGGRAPDMPPSPSGPGRVLEVAAGRAATAGLGAAFVSELLTRQSVLSQLLGRYEGPRLVEQALPAARSAALAVLLGAVALSFVEHVSGTGVVPRWRPLGLSPALQVWLGRAAMAAFLALLAFETVHSNRPAFGTLWYLWF